MVTITAPADIEQRVFRVAAETFPQASNTLTRQTTLKRDLGADSMQIIAFMIALDAEFDAEFAAEDIPRTDVTLAWVCDFVLATMQGATAERT
ncbi:MAG: phosphopantetheine-binding protein [Parvibaculaceae bacterium]